ncbi:MAG TPA: SWIM zinc finger family protein [Pirellulales bacterium]|nr:SWIM zinc finger family protein [Pirellulales bacterium]
MAEHGPLLTRLRDALAALDDDALAALANKGLLRRARKDLEQTPAEIVGQAFQPDAEEIQVRVGGETVFVPANPVQARCSCPAGGVCRHILAAIVHLRETATAQPEPTDAAPPAASADALFASLDDEALRRWAGKPLVRRATKALAEGLKVELDDSGPLVVRFPSRNITCRLVPGAGLAGLICSCQVPDVCEHRVAAVLAWQVAQGTRTIAAEEAVLPAADEAPRTRDEVLASVQVVLGEMFSVGLARLSTATSQRLQTLAVSCHGVQLPRLERWLTVLADETSRSLKRDAQSSAANLLEWSARVSALTAALAAPRPRLVGRHRTSYEQVGNLSLIGLGAERWSKAGYVGLTVYFWDESLGNWCSWSDTRPVNVWAFDPVRRFQEYGPWDGCSSPKVASHSRLQLTSVWRNPTGRLSGRSRTRASVLGESDPRQVPAICDWTQIGGRAQKLFGAGLSERNEQDELVHLRPSAWLPGSYDEVRQEFVRVVLDENDRALALALSFATETASAIQILEQHDATDAFGLLGRLRLRGGKLWVEPISLIGASGIVNLTLDVAQSASQPPTNPLVTVRPAKPVDESDQEPSFDEFSPDDVFLVGSSTPLGIFMSGIEAELEHVAESGSSVRRDLKPLEQAAARLDGLGLETVAASIAGLVAKLRVAPHTIGIGERAAAAAALLRAAYVVRLAIVEEALAVATAGLG